MSTVTASKPAKQAVVAQLAAERRELLDLCRQLRPEEWEQPSLCEGWQVRDVMAHLIGSQADWHYYLTSGGLHKANERSVDKRRSLPVQTLIGQFSALVRPGVLARAIPLIFLYDTWVHQQDIRWALGPERRRSQDPVRLRMILDYRAPKVTKAKPGLCFAATDLDWRAGQGRLVEGPAEALIMALFGRPAAYERLHGPGVAMLSNQP